MSPSRERHGTSGHTNASSVTRRSLAAVIGIPDKIRGEAIKAFVVAAAPTEALAAEQPQAPTEVMLKIVAQETGQDADESSANPLSIPDPKEGHIHMRKFLLFASAIGVLAAATALPAGADTTATFTLTAGGLSISAPTGSVSLGSQPASTSASTISGPLGAVTVSDQRGGVTTWTASVISTAFTPSSGPAVPASNISYAAGSVTASGVVPTAVPAPNLTGVSTVATGASTGISSASWNPTISVLVPANYAPGVYSATITHSVA